MFGFPEFQTIDKKGYVKPSTRHKEQPCQFRNPTT